ncbi:MAG: hypothetical protein LBP71_02930 [Spirochaetaceae bacterium]|nr:hypothetical protein [Spirochaetaceae bacterium]
MNSLLFKNRGLVFLCRAFLAISPLVLLLAPALPLGAEEIRDYGVLLQGFLEHDSEGQRLNLEKERAALELQKYALETGTSFTVSSGDTLFAFSPSGLSLSTGPGVELTFPKLRNTGFSLAVPLTSQGDRVSQYGVDLSVRTGLITGQGETYKAGLEEQTRNFIKALRNLESQRLAGEKKFCTLVAELLTNQNAVLKAQEEVIKAQYDLEQKRVDGYGAATVVLRTSELSLRTRERELREAERVLGAALKNFADSCGVDQAGIPEDIPEEELLLMASFDPNRYIPWEDAAWTHRVNSLKRRAQDRSFTLDGTAGYSWRNSSDGGAGMAGTSPGGSSVSAGISLAGPGLSFSTGVKIPLLRPDEPSLSLQVQWKPWGIKTSGLDRRLRTLSADRELQVIAEAEKQYRDLLTEYDRKREDLLWQQETYGEEAELYRLNAEEQKIWFDRGLIRELDYRNAQTNYLIAQNRIRSARIDRRLYNIDVQGLFVPRTDQEYEP